MLRVGARHTLPAPDAREAPGPRPPHQLVEEHRVIVGGRAKAHLAEQLDEKGPALAALLAGLSRDRLKEVCRQLDLDDGGRGELRAALADLRDATREAERAGLDMRPDAELREPRPSPQAARSYAGHASFAGQDGLDAALALADGPFSVRDILALERVPPYAVLLGCSSAGTDPGADSLGLAQAFLVKGALSVIAARVDLDAAVVEQLGARLAGGLDPTPDLPAALARAQAALAVESPALRWSVLRALVR